MNKALQRLPLLGIVIVALGCDNVEWGGIDIALRSPSDSARAEETELASDGEVASDANVADGPDAPPAQGPALYLGRRAGSQAWLVPVGQLRGDRLYPFVDEWSAEAGEEFASTHLAAGSRFTLFSEGVRVGTLTGAEVDVDEAYCGGRPLVRGPVELAPDAMASQRFLALPSETGSSFEYGEYAPVSNTRDLRVTSLTMMRIVIPEVGAAWPASVLAIRRDIRVFRERPGEEPTVVATFVYSDDLLVGPAPADAYSVFLMAADPDGAGYRTSYVDYRVPSRDGKATARYFDRLDWDGDGSPEILMEVMGESEMWIAALDRVDGVWVEAYRDSCGRAAATAQGRP